MGREIERRFLVKNNDWKKDKNYTKYRVHNITQGYLSIDPERVVRVRTLQTEGYQEEGFITVKGSRLNGVCDEYEAELHYDDAKAMLRMCIATLRKTRYDIYDKDDHRLDVWSVDVFKGSLAGLIIAEIELPSIKTKITLPKWLDKEITDDNSYSNVSLARFKMVATLNK